MKSTFSTFQKVCISKKGFTLIEMMFSLAILGIVLSAVILSLITMINMDNIQNKRIALVSDGQMLASFLRTTTRLTDVAEMVMYPPENSPHIAISYPVPEGKFHSENNMVFEDGALVWGQTYIIHPWPSNDPKELRLTRFRPRNISLSATDREQQLEDVTLNGNGENTFNGVNSDTRTLTRFTPDFTFRPEGGIYNFYKSSDNFEKNVNLGAVRLQSGENTIRLRAKGKSPSSSGFGMKIDRLFISPAGLALETESMDIESGNTNIEENTLGMWSDRKVLSFPAAGSGAEMEVNFFNDTWHETLFLGGGNELVDCVTGMNRDAGSVGTYLRPSGREPTWFGNMQAGAEGSGMDNDFASGAAVRVVIKGSWLKNAGYIMTEGDGITVKFKASDVANKSLRIKHAFIAEASSQSNPGPDIDEDTLERLSFGSASNAKNWVNIGSGGIAETVPTDFPIDPSKSYVISYWVHDDNPNQGNPWHFRLDDSEHPEKQSLVSTYLLPLATNPVQNDLKKGNWSSVAQLQTLPGILGVESITTTYVNEGVFTSRIVDTRLSDPKYHDIDWEGDFPDNTTVGFQIRTGNQADLSDALEWEDVSPMYSEGSLNVSRNRYVQVRITLSRNRVLDEIPELSHFTLRWWGEPVYAELGGDFQQFPSGGIAEFFVNDRPPTSTLRSELRLTRKGKTKEDVADTWKLTVESTPRN